MKKMNSDFWNDDKTLKSDVRDVMLKVKEDVLTDLKEEYDIDLNVEQYIFLGSLTDIDWDENSDVDLHFMVDFSDYDELLEPFLDFYSKKFNLQKYDLCKHSLEINFLDIDSEYWSPGIYDIDNDEWIQPPKIKRRNDIDYPEVKRVAAEKYREIIEFKNKFVSGEVKDLEKFLAELDDYKNELKTYRQKGLESKMSLYSVENLVFKKLRRNGGIQALVDLKKDVQNKIYDVDRTPAENVNESFNSFYDKLFKKFEL